MLSIRKAASSDAPLILDFVRRLAVYQQAPAGAVVATEADLIRDGFGADPKYRCVIAEWDRKPVGFAFFLYNYSTWLGRPGLYLEDLFVDPEMRGKGVGKALLQYLAAMAIREECWGISWMVYEANESAVKFYELLGAEMLDEKETMRLYGPALERLARGAAAETEAGRVKKSGASQ